MKSSRLLQVYFHNGINFRSDAPFELEVHKSNTDVEQLLCSKYKSSNIA